MNQNLIYNLPRLNSTKYENIFNVYTDVDNNYYYNLLQTIVFPDNLPNSFFVQYTVGNQDAWTLISYKMYNTIDLWWVILLANKISNPLEPLIAGTVLKIPNATVVKDILSQIIS